MGAARACFNRIAVECPMYHWRAVFLRCLSSAFAVSGIAVIAGCAPMVEQRGNLPTPEKLAEIQPGVTSKDEVIKILGSPSSVSIFNDKSWYYISRRTGQTAFFEPDVLDQQVYIVSFDDQGVVKTVDHKGVQDARAIDPVPRATPAPGRELTFLEQVIGNVGKFNNAGSSKSSSGSGPTGRPPS
jgi:outer membrane protein assembly factor BamE (lipoprotein component of BamABCDE complex)